MRDIPTTRYADSDGVQIAYQVVGEGDIDVLFLPMWYSHVELIWEGPRRRRFLERLASFSRLIPPKRPSGSSFASTRNSRSPERVFVHASGRVS